MRGASKSANDFEISTISLISTLVLPPGFDGVCYQAVELTQLSHTSAAASTLTTLVLDLCTPPGLAYLPGIQGCSDSQSIYIHTHNGTTCFELRCVVGMYKVHELLVLFGNFTQPVLRILFCQLVRYLQVLLHFCSQCFAPLQQGTVCQSAAVIDRWGLGGGAHLVAVVVVILLIRGPP